MNIPDGWYQLKKDTLIVVGDYCVNHHYHPIGYKSIDRWERCMGIVNRKVGDRYCNDYVVIRQGKDQSTPPPEKEWLNPWD